MSLHFPTQHQRLNNTASTLSITIKFNRSQIQKKEGISNNDQP
jgi:hypothetical protein